MMIVTKFLRACCHPVTVDKFLAERPPPKPRSDMVLPHAL